VTGRRLLRRAAVLGACALAGCGGAEADAPAAVPAGMVLIPGGSFVMGSRDGPADERPAHRVTVRPFLMDAREVTTAEFARFVAATRYLTDAERWGWSGVFDVRGGQWTRVPGATWRHPEGPDAPAAGPDEPVTQVSWTDAQAYARWAGKRLPTEAEWEFAARGGVSGREYAWGDELRPGGKPVANWWQGRFPEHNTAEDGYPGRAPAGRFPPTGYGLYDVAGNVWEWVADWYAADAYAAHAPRDPTGPASGREKVLRGGSWACAENFCSNYRVAGRSRATPDTGLNNTGFRLARDP
jgi:sulfatase modifying factor 1